MTITRRPFLAALAATFLAAGSATAADAPDTVTLDWAYYNPVSLVLKDKGWVEEALAGDGVEVQWVQSLGSNKALEFLNAESIDFGSTAGAAALLGRINGNPIKAIYVYSKPEWTALVTRPDTGIATVADLKGRKVAATKGTDPFIFLLRALDGAGLAQSDIELVLLQHADGKAALERGDVDAWAGLDPMMATTELESGSKLFFRDPDANTYGVLNVREQFLVDHPDIVAKVLDAYERGRHWAIENPGELQTILATAAKLKPEVAARQLERTDLGDPKIGDKQRQSISAAGQALQKAGVIAADVDVNAQTDALIDPQFAPKLATN